MALGCAKEYIPSSTPTWRNSCDQEVVYFWHKSRSRREDKLLVVQKAQLYTSRAISCHQKPCHGIISFLICLLGKKRGCLLWLPGPHVFFRTMCFHDTHKGCRIVVYPVLCHITGRWCTHKQLNHGSEDSHVHAYPESFFLWCCLWTVALLWSSASCLSFHPCPRR